MISFLIMLPTVIALIATIYGMGISVYYLFNKDYLKYSSKYLKGSSSEKTKKAFSVENVSKNKHWFILGHTIYILSMFYTLLFILGVM